MQYLHAQLAYRATSKYKLRQEKQQRLSRKTG